MSFIPGIVWLLFSIFLLTLPGSVLPTDNWLDKIWADKWVHIFLFGMLFFLWALGIKKRSVYRGKIKAIFFYLLLACIVFGVGMEFIQKYFVPNRSFDFGDIVADTIGSLAGFIYCSRRLIKK